MPQRLDDDALWRVEMNVKVDVWAGTEEEAVNLAADSTRNWHDWNTDQVGHAVRIPPAEEGT